MRDIRLMAQFLIMQNERKGLFSEAEQIRILDEQLLTLLGHKATRFDLVDQVARGKTLLVGEGNFSFALSLTKMARISPAGLTATSLEDESDLMPLARRNAEELRTRRARILHGVDATDLASTFGRELFDNIIFQFPNVASREPIRRRNPNFVLVRDFLKSASFQLARNGQVLISAVDSSHYRGAFQFEEAAEMAGFLPPEVHPFDPDRFPGYEHTMAHEDGGALDQHDKFSTWVFKAE